MMLSKVEYENAEEDEKLHSGQLLRDIEAISRALYLHKPRSDVRSKSVGKTRSTGSKPRISDEHHLSNEKSSVWNWKKSLKSLAHIGHRRFDVCFFLHVHSIEGLPLGFNDISLSVHWKRKDQVLTSRPARVIRGVAEFDEALMHRCYVYGNRTGPQNSAKYDGKLFMIYVSVTGTLDINFGKRYVDLTKLLPCTLEELETEKNSGKWTTSFGLAGKAKGAILNVSFGFSVERDKNFASQVNQNHFALDHLTHNLPPNVEPRTRFAASMSDEMLQCVRSIPHSLNHQNPLCFQSVDIKNFDEVPPNVGLELSKSIKFLYQKLNEVNLHSSNDLDALSAHPWPENAEVVDLVADRSSSKDACDDDFEFTIIDQGIEMPEKFELDFGKTCLSDVGIDGSEFETIDFNEIIKDDDESPAAQTMSHLQEIVCDSCVGSLLVADTEDKEKTGSVHGSSAEHPEAACLVPGDYAVDSLLSCNYFTEHENYMEMNSDVHNSVKKSLSFGEVSESVANDFLNMLGSDHGSFRMNSDCIAESPRERLLREFEKEALSCGDFILDCDSSRDDDESAYFGEAGSSYGSICQDFDLPFNIRTSRKEQDWAIELPSRRTTARVVEDLETEALMREWGLNEDAFQSSPHDYSGGFGSPIEVAREKAFELPPLGDGFGPLVQTRNRGYLRSISRSIFGHSKNFRNLIMQISPQVVLPAATGCDILEILQQLASVGIDTLSSQTKKLMPLQDLTGKTLDQIVHGTTDGATSTHRFNSPSLYSNVCASEMASEYVSLEDLVPLALDKIEVLSIQGLRIQSGLSDEIAPATICPQPARELQVLDDRGESSTAADGLLDISVTLEEWLRIDAGMRNEEKVSEQTTAVLRAHQAKLMNIVHGILGEGSTVRYGVLSNILTVAFMMQLRDPLRDYEPVGASMLALIQAERGFLHLDSPEEGSIGFKICGVHVSGLNTDPGRTQLWGTKVQQQSGVRWLLASGLSKSHKYPVSKSKAIVVSRPQQMSKVATGDILWSMSCGWEEGTGFTRNPDVELPGQCH